MLNGKLWDQARYSTLWNEQPEVRRLAQSKGKARMTRCPAQGDSVDFVLKGQIVMRGVIDSHGFHAGTRHKEHSCNNGTERPHAELDEFIWVDVRQINLSIPVPLSGQRTWVKTNPHTWPSG